MFKTGFNKIAGTLKSNISPEEYYELKGEKDPYVGALAGAVIGAAAGGIKKRTSKHALIGAGLGGAAGASTGYLTGKANKAIRLSLLKNEIQNLKLKASPSKGDYDHGGGM
jgi:gas vesicle protein